MAENLGLTLAFGIPLIPILLAEKKRGKYVALGFFAVGLAIAWEIFAVHHGFWEYDAVPQILGASIYTILAYFPWLIYSYYAGNKVNEWLQT
ncbi:MAG: hypothetical protein NUV67_04495 [archaeon]|nr:hypothetical protein [archaeon]